MYCESVNSESQCPCSVSVAVNDADGGSHTSGEITHSGMKILCLGNLWAWQKAGLSQMAC